MTVHGTCFTIETTIAGFTDQLLQFSAFYKLGTGLGLRYLHTPLVSERSNAGYLLVGAAPREVDRPNPLARLLRRFKREAAVDSEDVFDFLGINRHFEASGRSVSVVDPSWQRHAVDLSDDVLRERGIQSFGQLRDYVMGVAGAGDPALLTLRLVGPRARLFGMIHGEFPEFPDGLDLPGIYAAERGRAPIPALFQNGGLKLAVHIRQGDTAVIHTPWNTCMPVGFGRPDQFKEYAGFGRIESASQLFEVEEYRAFVNAMLEQLGQPRRSVLVFSDGANRGLRIVERNNAKLNWSPAQIDSFRAAVPDYDRRQFQGFSRDPHTRLVVGEHPTKLRQLIDSVLAADVVVVSSQFRMVPKLLASFAGERLPKAIVLYKANRPDYSDLVRAHEDRFIYVDIAKPDFDAVLRRLEA